MAHEWLPKPQLMPHDRQESSRTATACQRFCAARADTNRIQTKTTARLTRYASVIPDSGLGATAGASQPKGRAGRQDRPEDGTVVPRHVL